MNDSGPLAALRDALEDPETEPYELVKLALMHAVVKEDPSLHRWQTITTVIDQTELSDALVGIAIDDYHDFIVECAASAYASKESEQGVLN